MQKKKCTMCGRTIRTRHYFRFPVRFEKRKERFGTLQCLELYVARRLPGWQVISDHATACGDGGLFAEHVVGIEQKNKLNLYEDRMNTIARNGDQLDLNL